MNRKDKTITAATVIIGGGLATEAGLNIARHGVNTSLTIAASMGFFTTALTLGVRLLDATRTHTYRCAADGCDLVIRTQGVSDAERERYAAMVANHPNHTATGSTA